MKKLLISGVVGLLFMVGGFFWGHKLAPVPPAPVAAAVPVGKGVVAAIPTPPAITVETLKKASESLMNLNEALQTREQNVAKREALARQKEDELHAERKALDRSHERFKTLFKEFKDRLQIVEDSQLEQLHRQAELYTTMGTAQSIDLIRAMDDSTTTRLFSVMEVKPLAKLLSDWKVKYPEDNPRLLKILGSMSQVMPQSKMALTQPPATPVPNGAGPSAPSDNSAPTDAPDNSTPPSADPTATTNAPPSPSTTDSPAPAPPATADAPAASGTDQNAATPAGDNSTTPAPTTTAPASPSPPPSLAPPPDSTPAPVSTATSN